MSVQFHGHDFGGTGVFLSFISLLCVLFKCFFLQILVIFKLYTLKETVIEKALHANECVRWIDAFIADLGHPLWGSQSLQELASGIRNVLHFLIRDAKSCIELCLVVFLMSNLMFLQCFWNLFLQYILWIFQVVEIICHPNILIGVTAPPPHPESIESGKAKNKEVKVIM